MEILQHMLRAVKIFIQGEKIYDQNYGKSLDEDSFNSVLRNIMKDAFKYPVEDVKYHDFYKYRISYLPISSQEILFLFISDLSDKFESIEKEIKRCKKEFMSMFSGILGHSIDPKTFSIFDPAVETIHKNLRPKISLVGFSGVGKTTITRLIRAEEIPTKHIPTITGDIATIKIGNLHFHLWDFAGQEQFSFLWNNFVHGSDAVLIITDSTLENVEKSKYFIELIKKEAPNAHQAVIGNKQDLPNALPLADLERILNVKTYSMVATDPNNRDKMITIIADILEMSSEVSPLLRPLIERDRQVLAAEMALEEGDFQQAVQIFMDVSDLCLTLGDDVVSQEFQEKAMKIKNILKTVQGEVALDLPDPKPKQSPPPPSSKPISESEQQETPPLSPPKPTAPPATIPIHPPVPPPSPTPKNPQSPPSEKQPGTNLDQLNILVKGLNSSSATPKPKIKKPVAVPPPPPQIDPVVTPQPALNSQKPPAPPNNKPVPPPQPPPSTYQTPELNNEDLKREILDLKLKLTDISKHIIDLDMENIMGSISNEEFEEKQKKLQALEKTIKEKITVFEQKLK
ncbi:MAG: GTP-binding protein [Promethearchaeota archaeon]|nr:MAG: GTP-binding protein [Candidatus Lokiarchaeota archaeon]